jgi:transcriptional regulator with XRE-family HTH domain
MAFGNIISVDSKVFGARIRAARERLGMSQEDLAAAVSKDQGSISEYESGKRRLSAVDLPIFARVLRVPLLYFYEGDLLQTDVDRLLLDEFRRLPSSEAQQAALEIIRVLSTHFGDHEVKQPS